MKVVATQGSRRLIVQDNADTLSIDCKAFIDDPTTGLSPEMPLYSILARGYWTELDQPVPFIKVASNLIPSSEL